jgi:DNA-binding MarR family transcriptional regulator
VSRALGQVHRLHRAAAGELLKCTGLYPGQELLMMHLWDAGPVRQADLIDAWASTPPQVIALSLLQLVGEESQSDLGEALRVDRTNLVGLLNDLETADLIERRPSPQDRRRHTVSLTPAGTRRLAEVQNALAAAEQRVLSALDAEQRATLHALLQQVAANTAECSEQSQAPRNASPRATVRSIGAGSRLVRAQRATR